VIIDSSAWIDFLNQRATPVALAVRAAIGDASTRLMTTDVIRLEILAGSDRDSARRRMNSLLAGCEDVAQLPRADVDDAVELFQICRKRGETVRSPNDCLIAAIAIRVGAPILHADRVFDVLARHTPLRTVPWP
jgi:predicted nucleic acid-binding protein